MVGVNKAGKVEGVLVMMMLHSMINVLKSLCPGRSFTVGVRLQSRVVSTRGVRLSKLNAVPLSVLHLAPSATP